ncbi:L-histidine N(alpha)-methyltransferase [Spirosoma horti]
MAVYGDTFSEELKTVSIRHGADEVERGSMEAGLEIDVVDSPLAESSDLANEVRTGLQATPKRLSSRFFYDAEGSRLFAEIMRSPDYYLTRSEYEILETHKAAMLQQFSPDKRSFELVELGAGDGLKTKILLGFFESQKADFTYAPIDISADALEGLVTDLRRQWPDLPLSPRHDDYFSALELLSQETDNRKVVLFLGSNIGNFAPDDAVDFYQQLHDRLKPGDMVLTGFDLQKNPAVIHTAYNDREGLTKAFNLNLLRRINRELEANFDLDSFDHYETYNPENGEARSYLVSQKAQPVTIKALDLQVSFQAGEIIHTEISRKFSRVQIEQLASQTGFTVTSLFTDSKGYFADVVFVR